MVGDRAIRQEITNMNTSTRDYLSEVNIYKQGDMYKNNNNNSNNRDK